MFYRDGKKRAASQAKPIKDLARILGADQILNEAKRGLLIKKIEESLPLDASRFENLCLPLLQNAANYYQNLPETLNAFYSQAGGLIEHALHRTESALNLFKQYLIVEEENELSEEQQLWLYVLFSAAILQGVGKLYVDFVVDIYDGNGQFLKPWNPLLEALGLSGAYYTCRFQKEADLEFRRRVNLLLARTLMPTAGFAWIISNPQALSIWLSLINEDFYSAGTLGAVLERGDALALQLFWSEFLVKINASRSKYAGVGTFSGSPEVIEIEQKTGAEFLDWLRKSLGDGDFAINKHPVILVHSGLLVTDDLIGKFMQAHPEYKNIEAVRKGVLSLNLHEVGPEGSIISRYSQNNNQAMHAGFIINVGVALPPQVQFHNIVSGQTVPGPAELAYLYQFENLFTRQQRAKAAPILNSLNKAGQWQKVTEVLSQSPSPFLSGMNKIG